MSHELICSWLGLPVDCWPPDHYRLLGLQSGESDVAVIEEQVHQRHDSLRRYQMMYPEQATEAMNRLAQAFVCLTDPAAKKAYDEQVLGRRASTPPPMPRIAPPPLPTPAEPSNPHGWLGTPGINGPTSSSSSRLPPPLPAAPVEPEVVAAAKPAAQAELIDPIRESAQRSERARFGLGTRGALHQRVLLTRHLMRLWYRLGKHLEDPGKKLTRPEATEMKKLLQQLEDDGASFPLLGEAGQPGHLILSLTQFDRSKDLLTLDHAVRESLKRDWDAGLKFLELHRDFLRGELVAYRRRGRRQRLMLAVRAWLNTRPLTALLIFGGALALTIAWIAYCFKDKQ